MTNPKSPPRLCVVGYIFFEVFLPLDHPPPEQGEEIFVEDIPIGLGGALNTASVAKALGLEVTLLHPNGGGLTDIAASHTVKQLGIREQTWKTVPDPAISLVISTQQDRSFISKVDRKAMLGCPRFPGADWVHVGGLNEARDLTEQIATAREAGVKVSVSGCWSPEELARLSTVETRQWDLLILNEKEARTATGQVETAPLLLQNVAENIIVTLGSGGACGWLGGEQVRVEAPKLSPLDCTGAGDGFCAGLISALLRGLTGENALRIAVGSASVMLGIRGGVAMDRNTISALEELL